MWSHYNNNSNTNNSQRPQQQPQRHHPNNTNNEYESPLPRIQQPQPQQNTNNDPLSALAAYTLDPSANATAFAAASSVNRRNSSEYYYSSSSPSNQQQHQRHQQQRYHRNDSPYYIQQQQHQQQQPQQDWSDHRHRVQQQPQQQQQHNRHRTQYHDEYLNKKQQSSSEEEDDEIEEDQDDVDIEDDELANINQNVHGQQQQQDQYQSDDDDDDGDNSDLLQKQHQQKNHQTMNIKTKAAIQPSISKKNITTSSTFLSTPIKSPLPKPKPKGNTRMPSLEYECISTLLEQFCKVPLLAEFNQPVSKLHPELMSAYSKVVKYPMDLSKVCRRFHRHYYSSLQSFQVDMWRIFTNCILFHSHPTANKHGHAIPSFISLALHLREFFNSLWQEYVMPSDEVLKERDEGRKIRLNSISTTLLTVKCMKKAAGLLHSFIQSQGCVDRLDEPLKLFQETLGDKDGAWSKQVHYALKALRSKILQMAENNQSLTTYPSDPQGTEMEYSLENLSQDLDSIGAQSPNPARLQFRLHRLLGKIVVPIYETNCRGVNQSSIWGCMAAAIWARESAKKRFWPALVLGILAPDDQKEDWHVTLTERNEARLPERLRQDLQVAKRKAEASLEKQTYAASVSGHSIEVQSYFLVEFMGKHEFTWVREADIIENFDPSTDVNANSSKKKSSSSSAFLTAIEEGKWAVEEFDMQLRDQCGDLLSDGEDDGDAIDEDQATTKHTSFKRLCQPKPDEGDDFAAEVHSEELEQIKQELIANNGLIDFSTEGRKQAKTKATEIKESRKQQQQSSSSKKSHKKKSAVVVDEEKERRKIEKQVELERKRVEKELKAATAAAAAKKKKISSHHEKKKKTPEKRKTTPSSNNSKKISDKRYRAEMVIQGYLSRIAQNNDSKDLSLSVFMTNPDSFGLLGMALAFRAASNDIEWNDPSDPQNLKKPWEKLETDAIFPSSAQRCALLKNRIALVENELDELSKAQERRLQLMETAEDNVGRYFNKMMELDQHARIVPSSLKRKKKPAASSGHTKTSKKSKKTSTTVVKASPVVHESAVEDDVDPQEPASHGKGNRTPTPSALEDADEEESEDEAPVIAEAEESLGETDDDDEDGRLNDTAMSDDLDSDEDDD